MADQDRDYCDQDSDESSGRGVDGSGLGRAERQNRKHAREAQRRYEEAPTSSEDIKTAILEHLTEMETPIRERAEVQRSHDVRRHLIGQLDDPDSLHSQNPGRGDTLQMITLAVQAAWPGTPGRAISETLKTLVEDGLVARDDDASKRFGDEVYRIRDGSGLAHAVQPERAKEELDIPSPDEDSHLSPARLAELFGLPPDPLRKRLARWRAGHDEGWIENSNRKTREAQFLYRVGSIRPVLEDMMRSAERPASDRRKKN